MKTRAWVKGIKYRVTGDVSPVQQLRRMAQLSLALAYPPPARDMTLAPKDWKKLMRAMKKWVASVLPEDTSFRRVIMEELVLELPYCGDITPGYAAYVPSYWTLATKPEPTLAGVQAAAEALAVRIADMETNNEPAEPAGS